MRTLFIHQMRPRIYFGIGSGLDTEKWYDQKLKAKKIHFNNQ